MSEESGVRLEARKSLSGIYFTRLDILSSKVGSPFECGVCIVTCKVNTENQQTVHTYFIFGMRRSAFKLRRT